MIRMNAFRIKNSNKQVNIRCRWKTTTLQNEHVFLFVSLLLPTIIVRIMTLSVWFDFCCGLQLLNKTLYTVLLRMWCFFSMTICRLLSKSAPVCAWTLRLRFFAFNEPFPSSEWCHNGGWGGGLIQSVACIRCVFIVLYNMNSNINTLLHVWHSYSHTCLYIGI